MNRGGATVQKKTLAGTAAKELRKPIRKKLKIRSLFEWDGETLNVLVHRNGRSQLSLTRLPNGQIEARRAEGCLGVCGQDDCSGKSCLVSNRDWSYGYENPEIDGVALRPVESLIRRHMQWVRGKVRAVALQEHPEARRIDSKFFKQHYPGESKDRAAQAAIETELLRTVGKTAGSPYDPGRIGKVVMGEWGRMVDLKAAREAPGMMNSAESEYDGCTIDQYNALVRHGPALSELREEAPLAAMIWWNCFTGSDSPPAPENARSSDLAMQIRGSADFKPAEWRLLMDLGRLAFTKPDECAFESDIKMMRTGVSAVTQANVPNACPALAASIMMESHQSDRMRSADRAGAVWKRWVWAVRRALLEHECAGLTRESLERMRAEDREWAPYQTQCGAYSEPLFHIGHAIAWHARNEVRWRNSNWRNLLLQAVDWMERPEYERYHGYYGYDGYENRHDDWDLSEIMLEAIEANRRKKRIATRTSWHSLVDEQEIAGFTVTPVTNSMELHDLGQEMDNCLPYYGVQCEDGDVRIFALHLPGGRLAAAGEILRRPERGWAVGEVQTMGDRTPQGAARLVMARVAEMYREAERAETGPPGARPQADTPRARG